MFGVVACAMEGTVKKKEEGGVQMLVPGKSPNKRAKSRQPLPVAMTPPPITAADGVDGSAAPELKREQIARLAYSYWEARGCKGGSAEEDWVRAEQELRTQKLN